MRQNSIACSKSFQSLEPFVCELRMRPIINDQRRDEMQGRGERGYNV
jgi:hypothetical protein